jgi:Protein of unknown function (DUF3800)
VLHAVTKPTAVDACFGRRPLRGKRAAAIVVVALTRVRIYLTQHERGTMLAAQSSYALELSELLRCDWMAMLHAYCDESYNGDTKTTPLYVVAGFIGEAEQWRLFESLWTETMKSLDIRAIGCHAAKCAGGGGPYRHMSGQRRATIQERLIIDIAACKLFGVVSVVDVDAYRSNEAALVEALSKADRRMFKPHVLAVSQCVRQMCLVTAPVTTEPIAFVIDRNDTFGKRAKAWYDLSTKDPQSAHRLGPYAEDDRTRSLGLQAADMLAYAGFRYANGRKDDWRWRRLKEAVKISEWTTGAAFWSTLVQRFHEARVALAEQRGENGAPT